MNRGLSGLFLFLVLTAPAWGQNPYSYETAKALFESRASLRNDPGFARLLAAAEGEGPADREESRRTLTQDAYPLALALNEIDSGGAAPAYFGQELKRNPPDYRGIVARFPDYEAAVRHLAVAERERLDVARSAEIGEAMKDHAAALARVFLDMAITEGEPPQEASSAQKSLGPDKTVDRSLRFAVSYRLDKYQPEDHQGDVSLLAIAGRVPKAMVKVATGGHMPVDGTTHPYEDLNPLVKPDDPPPSDQEILDRRLPAAQTERLLVEARNKRLVLEGRRDPIKVPAMTKMFTQIFAEEAAKGVPPKLGKPLGWSREFLAEDRERPELQPYARVSKLLIALSCGLTSKFMPTDHERRLIAYILGRPDRSVTFAQLFRESYELNDGDVYLALLTCENVLSEFWLTPQRENRAVTRKLAPITNVYDGRGDIYGTWYHFTGTLLYSYVTNGKIAGSVAHTESMGSNILSNGMLKPQKVWANREGAVLGEKVRDALVRRDYLGFNGGGVDWTDPKVYQNLSEDFRDRIAVVESADFSAAVSKGAVELKSLNGDHENCKVELMPDSGSGFDSDKTAVVDKASFKKGAAATVYKFSRGVKKVRIFIGGCDDRFEGVVTAGGKR